MDISVRSVKMCGHASLGDFRHMDRCFVEAEQYKFSICN